MIEIRRLQTTEPDCFFDGKHGCIVRKVEKLQYRYVEEFYITGDHKWSDWIDVKDVWEE